MFALHPQLQADTICVAEWPLSLVLLAKDANYPWCILVPQREGLSEIHHLSSFDREQLLKESCYLSELMEQLFQPTKMNVAALGNMVEQLHLHHVARFDHDPAWPKPIWGAVEPVSYREEVLQERLVQLKQGCEEAF